MKDRYLYRAKRTDNGEWVEGFYFCMEHTDGRHTHHFIMPLGTDLSLGTPIEKIQVDVDPSTICQCTGLKDKNSKLIWENDIVIINGWIGKVMWSSYDTAYIVLPNDDIKNETYCLGYWVNEYNVEVIGNEIDNLELLEVGE